MILDAFGYIGLPFCCPFRANKWKHMLRPRTRSPRPRTVSWPGGCCNFVGPQNVPKTHATANWPKSDKKRTPKTPPNPPKSTPKRTKIYKKNMHVLITVFIDFCSKLDAKTHPKIVNKSVREWSRPKRPDTLILLTLPSLFNDSSKIRAPKNTKNLLENLTKNWQLNNTTCWLIFMDLGSQDRP